MNDDSFIDDKDLSFWEDDAETSLKIPIKIEYFESLKNAIKEFNEFINVYNANVIWFKNVAISLEKIFANIIKSLNTSVIDITKSLDELMKSDGIKDRYRNYKLLVDIIIRVYQSYVSILFDRINEFTIYVHRIEKQLSYAGALIIKGLWWCYHYKLGINLPDKRINAETRSDFVNLIESIQFDYVDNLYKKILATLIQRYPY